MRFICSQIGRQRAGAADSRFTCRSASRKIALRRGLIKSRLAQTQRNTRKSKIRGLRNQAAAFKSEFKLLEF